VKKEHIHSLLVSLWSIQNSILQSVRGIFITVESILIPLRRLFLFQSIIGGSYSYSLH